MYGIRSTLIVESDCRVEMVRYSRLDCKGSRREINLVLQGHRSNIKETLVVVFADVEGPGQHVDHIEGK